jgi:hypothetical protein
VDVFPEPIRRFATSAAKALPCPVDFFGCFMLAVFSIFIGRKRSIAITPSWVEYCVLWIACVARSGERKTPAFKLATAPLREKQRELYAEYIREKKEWGELSAEDQKGEPKPRLKQLFTTDTTIEALKELLDGNPDGGGYPADELTGWIRSMCQYKGGRGDDRQHYLSIWACVQVVRNRVGKEPIILEDPFWSIFGGIQPSCLGDLIDDAREDGLSARFLFTYPDPLINTDWTETPIEGADEYARVCNYLYDLTTDATPIRFSAVAKSVWVQWINAHREEAPPDGLRPAWSKFEGYCQRLALVLFLIWRACSPEPQTLTEVLKRRQVGEESITDAIKLIEYFKSHARRVFSSFADLGDRGRIGNALRWVKRHGGRVTARQARQYGLCRDSEEAKELLLDLQELGHGTVSEEARKSIVFTLRGPTDPTPYEPTVEEEPTA